jgi:hypothetical protein
VHAAPVHPGQAIFAYNEEEQPLELATARCPLTGEHCAFHGAELRS